MVSRHQETLAAIRDQEAHSSHAEKNGRAAKNNGAERTPAEIFMGQLRQLNWEQHNGLRVADIKPQHATRYNDGFDQHGVELGFDPIEHNHSHVAAKAGANGFEIRLTEGEFNRSGLAAQLASRNGQPDQAAEQPATVRTR